MSKSHKRQIDGNYRRLQRAAPYDDCVRRFRGRAVWSICTNRELAQHLSYARFEKRGAEPWSPKWIYTCLSIAQIKIEELRRGTRGRFNSKGELIYYAGK